MRSKKNKDEKNNELKIFENEEFGRVGVISVNGEPYFDLYAVGMALG